MVSFTAANTKRMFSVSVEKKKDRVNKCIKISQIYTIFDYLNKNFKLSSLIGKQNL